jgi:hypothetical protein
MIPARRCREPGARESDELAAQLIQGQRGRRNQDECDHRGEDHPEAQRHRHRLEPGGLGTSLEEQRQQPKEGREGGQQDGPEARHARLQQGFAPGAAGVAQAIGAVQQHQRIVHDHSRQRDQPDLRESREGEPHHAMTDDAAHQPKGDGGEHDQRLEIGTQRYGQQRVGRHQGQQPGRAQMAVQLCLASGGAE